VAKVVMVGRDKAPSEAFEALKTKLVGEEVVAYLGHGDPIKETLEKIKAAASGADVLLCGMSSSPKLVAEEIAAIISASINGVPVVLYADTHGCVHRAWFEGVRDRVNAVLVVSNKEADAARQLFPNAEPVLSGNPSVEESYFPKTTREQTRNRFGVREDEKLMLIPGCKFPAVTIPTVIAAINAVDMLSETNFFMVVSVHPGDDAWKANPDFYDNLIKYFTECKEVTDLANLRWTVSCGKHPNEERRVVTSDILPGVDIVVATMSTEEQKAACQRIPVVEYLTAVDLDRMEKNFGTRDWECCEQGVAEKVFGDHAELAAAIDELLNPTSANSISMRQAQKLHYPKPSEPGYALRVMAETVLKYTRK